MQRYCSTNQAAQAVDMDVATLSRAAVAINLQSGSLKQGSKRLLDFDSALALVLAIRSRQLAGFPVDLPGLFNFLYGLIAELGERAVLWSVLIDQNKGLFSISRQKDIIGGIFKIESMLTGAFTYMAIQPFYAKLVPLFGRVEVPETELVK